MARQIVTILTDDLDGGEAERTIEFSLDGVSYSIDLSDKNIGELRTRLDPFIAAGTRIGRTATVRRSIQQAAVPSPASNRDQNKAIRHWAIKHGHPVSPRGRIPASVIDAYHRNA
ncbi:histone-like nucleoid-structuring protein Lsr2 [Actinoplanes sp. CA-131856]